MIVLFILSIILWLGAVSIVISGIILQKISPSKFEGEVMSIVGSVISVVGTPIISQLVGLWPKVIHYKKTKTQIDRAEEILKEINDKENRNRIF